MKNLDTKYIPCQNWDCRYILWRVEAWVMDGSIHRSMLGINRPVGMESGHHGPMLSTKWARYAKSSDRTTSYPVGAPFWTHFGTPFGARSAVSPSYPSLKNIHSSKSKPYRNSFLSRRSLSNSTFAKMLSLKQPGSVKVYTLAPWLWAAAVCTPSTELY